MFFTTTIIEDEHLIHPEIRVVQSLLESQSFIYVFDFVSYEHKRYIQPRIPSLYIQ